VRKRIAFHGTQSPSWSNESQRFVVRCRVLDGSSHAWTGKSAAFDDVDFASDFGYSALNDQTGLNGLERTGEVLRRSSDYRARCRLSFNSINYNAISNWALKALLFEGFGVPGLHNAEYTD